MFKHPLKMKIPGPQLKPAVPAPHVPAASAGTGTSSQSQSPKPVPASAPAPVKANTPVPNPAPAKANVPVSNPVVAPSQGHATAAHDAFAMPQTWNPDRYGANARFVAELGMPVVELLAPSSSERILDLGCGDGFLTAKLAALGCS
ncbi:MAG: hypothetical protein ABI036_11020, partial [Fibrobacteria bacterium]